MKRIAIYDRYKSNESDMPEKRREAIADYRKRIEEAGNTIVDIFCDDCSELIPLNERKEYIKLYEKCKACDVDEIHVFAMSRISRDLTVITDMCDKVNQFGTKVCFVKEGVADEQLLGSKLVNVFAKVTEQEILM